MSRCRQPSHERDVAGSRGIVGTRRVARQSIPPMPPSDAAAPRRRDAPRRTRRRAPHLRLVAPDARPSELPTHWVEVAIAWGACPLRVVHLQTPARFVISDTVPAGARGFAAPLAEQGLAGGDVVIDRGGAAFARVPAASRHAWFTLPTGRTHGKSDGERAGLVARDADGALLFELRLGRRCRFDLGTITVEVAAIEAPEPQPTSPWVRWQWALLAVSVALNAIVIAALLRS